MKISDLFVQCLENEGVSHVFGVPGEENEDILFSIDASTIKFIPTRHELGAAFIANVWGRLTGDAGVCLATLGPGATNLITGVADANLDKAPLVAITGQGGRDRVHHEAHQYLDIPAMFKPITKWNTTVSSEGAVPEIVRKAFKVSEAEKPGATHIEVSEDIAAAEAEGLARPLDPTPIRRPHPDPGTIQKALDLLAEANKPMVIAGNGAIRKRASKHLRSLVARHSIPVASTFMGKGAVSDSSQQSLFALGLGFRDYVMDAVEQADLIVTVGYDLAEYNPARWNPNGDKKIVHIDFVPAEVYENYQPDIEVVGDISAALSAIDKAMEDKRCDYDREWYKPIRDRIVDDVEAYRLEEGQPFTIPGALAEIRNALPDDGLLISDVGSHKMWIARNYPTYVPNGCIISNGLASMGIALPGGIAGALVDNNRPVVSAMGDGGFMMNSQELETAKRIGVGFTSVIFNDDQYGLIRWKQTMSRGRSVSTELTNPDFKAYVESFGIKAYRPTTLSELRMDLAEAIGSGELNVIEVRVDPSVNDELVKKLDMYWEEK